MTRRGRWSFEPIPIATAAVLALTLPLPLRWSTLSASAIAIAALTLKTIRRARRASREHAQAAAMATAAAIALAAVGAIVLGYAAFALVRVGVFGPVGRLGYPFLVATGLRLEGGAWLVLLCGLVSVVPMVFNGQRGERKERVHPIERT